LKAEDTEKEYERKRKRRAKTTIENVFLLIMLCYLSIPIFLYELLTTLINSEISATICIILYFIQLYSWSAISEIISFKIGRY